MPKYVVRHGVMRHLGVFGVKGGDTYGRGAQVIARTNRGLELGEVLVEATEHVLSQMENPKHGQILRRQTEEDRHEIDRLAEEQQKSHQVCRERIAESQLEMQLVDVEHLYGGERVVVYYLAEGRIDFRELVKKLAKDFQTRIEMRQIGVRDEAKLLADYGDCGKPVCCNTHLSEMPPVSMRMAKLQKATLDPTKISGRCGRLKCCLRYEYDTYQQLQKDLPPVGSEIITNEGRAKVLAQEILSGQLLIEAEDRRRLAIDAGDVLTVLKRGGGRNRPRKRRTEHTPEGEQQGDQETPQGKQQKESGGRKDRSDRRRDGSNSKQTEVENRTESPAAPDAQDPQSGQTPTAPKPTAPETDPHAAED
ncbi:MAG: regulatory iron-sulfur-containing complex subunit RicT [Planctomycetota bacterium]